MRQQQRAGRDRSPYRNAIRFDERIFSSRVTSGAWYVRLVAQAPLLSYARIIIN
jgi:hypothetical protein